MTAETRACDYCTTQIPAQAIRCPSCAGEFRHCPTDQRLVGVKSKEVFVGLLRGGKKTRVSCLSCGRVLEGPRI